MLKKLAVLLLAVCVALPGVSAAPTNSGLDVARDELHPASSPNSIASRDQGSIAARDAERRYLLDCPHTINVVPCRKSPLEYWCTGQGEVRWIKYDLLCAKCFCVIDPFPYKLVRRLPAAAPTLTDELSVTTRGEEGGWFLRCKNDDQFRRCSEPPAACRCTDDGKRHCRRVNPHCDDCHCVPFKKDLDPPAASSTSTIVRKDSTATPYEYHLWCITATQTEHCKWWPFKTECSGNGKVEWDVPSSKCIKCVCWKGPAGSDSTSPVPRGKLNLRSRSASTPGSVEARDEESVEARDEESVEVRDENSVKFGTSLRCGGADLTLKCREKPYQYYCDFGFDVYYHGPYTSHECESRCLCVDIGGRAQNHHPKVIYVAPGLPNPWMPLRTGLGDNTNVATEKPFKGLVKARNENMRPVHLDCRDHMTTFFCAGGEFQYFCHESWTVYYHGANNDLCDDRCICVDWTGHTGSLTPAHIHLAPWEGASAPAKRAEIESKDSIEVRDDKSIDWAPPSPSTPGFIVLWCHEDGLTATCKNNDHRYWCDNKRKVHRWGSRLFTCDLYCACINAAHAAAGAESALPANSTEIGPAPETPEIETREAVRSFKPRDIDSRDVDSDVNVRGVDSRESHGHDHFADRDLDSRKPDPYYVNARDTGADEGFGVRDVNARDISVTTPIDVIDVPSTATTLSTVTSET